MKLPMEWSRRFFSQHASDWIKNPITVLSQVLPADTDERETLRFRAAAETDKLRLDQLSLASAKDDLSCFKED
ncbi:hypothetical protein [Roseibium limicola]|uniref:Uncharacterized protein n=1 Tax=Roseibium limicola TaxID=2816037 RepID=A0A939EQZ2_9HYPH|nr:hypothetical protein [Roseibium limicola]MBO0346351.1 hypothetical protein [Roseibium limicola]